MIRHLSAVVAATLVLCLPVLAQAPCYAEYDNAVFDDNVHMGGPNLTLAVKFTAPANLTVTSIQVWTGERTGNHTIGIYSHDSVQQRPLAWLSSGSWSMNVVNSWQGASMVAPIPLTSGTIYWLGWAPIQQSQASTDTTITGSGQPYMSSFDGGQSWGGPFQTQNHWKFRLFGTCSVSGPYCTAKVNSMGCTPAIQAAGTPSASAGNGWTVSASNVLNNQSGLLIYGSNGRTAIPFQNGTLCINLPVRRTPPRSSNGNPLPAIDCSGNYSIDMNAFAIGAIGGNPSSALTIAGSVIDCQWWARDPGLAIPNDTSLTNGYEYTVGP